MEDLFDPDKPYFAARLQLYDIDIRLDVKLSSIHRSTVSTESGIITHLYYAALRVF